MVIYRMTNSGALEKNGTKVKGGLEASLRRLGKGTYGVSGGRNGIEWWTVMEEQKTRLVVREIVDSPVN